jgi:hypothetical protein
MLVPERILTFDIGIRNLAWCLLEKPDDPAPWNILGWENYDLLAGSSSQEAKQKAHVTCKACSKKASHRVEQDLFCKKHCPLAYPMLTDLSGSTLTKIPGLPMLQSMAGPAGKKMKKVELVVLLAKKYSMPIEKIKVTKAIQTDLSILHSALQTFVTTRQELFRTAGRILLENQPAFKNPTMKSLQILLFATIRERVPPGVHVGFVHAGKKTKGSASGDKGYADRKKASETRVKEWFEKEAIADKSKWQTYLASNSKKNDLCDCLCMCFDAVGAK